MILKSDCIHFPGDRPCKPHKNTGVICSDCGYYETVGFKILIIKLDAIGDVLRTTSILHSLKKKYSSSSVIWLTKSNAKDIFINNELVSEVLIYEAPSTLPRLMTEKYDLVINLDPSPESCSLASCTNAAKKTGFGLNEKGKVYPFNEEAVEWFEMGAFDNLKAKNKKTYQQIIHEICSLEYSKGEIIFKLTDEEIKYGQEFFKAKNLGKFRSIVGINAGASGRWQFKKWRKEGYVELIKKLTEDLDCGILLFGGKNEIELNAELLKSGKNVIDTGNSNSLRELAAYINLVDILVTGDTLALHIATALKIIVVCLFGPTSSAEIEDYGLINKIVPEMDCLVCYKNTCDFKPNCMELISVDAVYDAVFNSLKKIKK